MNRRDFLKFFPSLSATLIPASVVVAAPEIRNTKDLTALIEKDFVCSMGSPGPYTTEEMNSDYSLNKTESLDPRFRYATIVCCSVGEDKVVEERRIAQFLYEKLKPMKGKELVWRKKPEFESKEIYEFGEFFAKKEDYEDLSVTPIPEKVAYDFETDTYRYYQNKYWLHRIRMRIAIPEAHQQLAQMDLSEGERAQRIA